VLVASQRTFLLFCSLKEGSSESYLCNARALKSVSTYTSHYLYLLEQCQGGNNFNELEIMKGLKFSDGSVLIEGKISWDWMVVLFWRSFLVLFFHYMCILLTGSLSLRLGWFEQRYIETQVDEEVERPSEDNATMFMFIKQVFYHKTLAYTKFEKKKRSGVFGAGCCKKKKDDVYSGAFDNTVDGPDQSNAEPHY
jgi:hypothetical protein